MQAACTHCGTQHVLKDSDVGAHPKVQFHCAKYGMKTVVDTRRHPNATMVISPLPSFARGDGSGSSNNFLQQDDAAKLPAIPSSSLFPAGVHRTTDPLRVSQHAVAAIRCSRSVVTKITSASQRLKMFLSLRAAVNTQSSVEKGMISNGSGIGVCLG